jgi:tryptophanyl-tRNA synthetase
MNKKNIFSGAAPSGNLHLGNYLGAISQWSELQNEYNCFFSVVNYHAITVFQDPDKLRKKTYELAKIYLAAGIDPKKSCIFIQSDVPEHIELSWILGCTATKISDLKKMTQFKDKSGSAGDGVGAGLFNYPVLMAADILLYDSAVVPVGDDQLQHVELARDIAKRFNNLYGNIFIIPEAKIRKNGARIMGLDNPEKKMSKSAPSSANYIGLADSPEDIRKKIMKAVTDSSGQISYDLKNKPAISNLLTIYSLVTKKTIKDLELEYGDKGYGDFKRDLADSVINFLQPFRERFKNISDKALEKILKDGAKKARIVAQKKLAEIKKVIGIV